MLLPPVGFPGGTWSAGGNNSRKDGCRLEKEVKLVGINLSASLAVDLLTVHDSYHTVLPALGVDVVVAQLTSGPADVTTFSSDLARDITGVESEGDVAERVREDCDQLRGGRLGIGVALLHSKVHLLHKSHRLVYEEATVESPTEQRFSLTS